MDKAGQEVCTDGNYWPQTDQVFDADQYRRLAGDSRSRYAIRMVDDDGHDN